MPTDVLDQLARTAQAEGRAPSLVLAVGHHGTLTRFIGLGSSPTPNEHTQYRIGSITKTFTAALIMQLRDEGRLGLDDPLDRYAPGTGAPGVTMRQLLTHTAGLQAEPDGPWWERSPGVSVVELLAGVHPGKVALPPGRHRHYSNLGFGLLGAVVEAVTGQTWLDALRERILDPLNLTRTTYLAQEPHATGYLTHPWQDVLRAEPSPDTQAMAPAGQLWSTAPDLLRWGHVLAGREPAVLCSETAEQMRTIAVLADGVRMGTGLAVAVYPRENGVFCGHSGSMPGFVACLVVEPRSGWSAVGFANCYTGVAITTLAHNALTAVLDDQPSPPAATWSPGPPAPPHLEPLLGRWWWMGEEVTVGMTDGERLTVTFDGEEPSVLIPDGTDQWRCIEGAEIGEVLHAQRDAGGVTALEIRTFVLLRDPWPDEPR